MRFEPGEPAPKHFIPLSVPEVRGNEWAYVKECLDTGWVSSVFNMSSGVAALAGGHAVKPIRLDWEDRRLLFVVREPFISRHSRANIVAGIVEQQQALELESLMPSGGVIFSDGVEADYLQFNSGSSVIVRAAEETAQLVAG